MTKALSRFLLAGVAAAVMLLAPAARADAPKAATGKPQTYAVLVGISEYADKQIKPRPNAEADVKALYDLIVNKERIGADPKNVKLLLGNPGDRGEKATRSAFLKAIKWLADEVEPQDMVLFAFIGQGGPVGDSGDRRCYFLVDSTFKNRDKDAVAAEEIEEALKKFKGKRFCAFLDVDFTGFKEGTAGRAAVAEPTLGKAPYREFLGDDQSEDHLPMPGRVAFLATNGLSPSLDLKDHGVFTTVLLEALQGKADSEGYEADGLVTVDELARYMNKRLPELVRKHGKTTKQKEQDHFVIAGPGSHFVLGSRADAVTPHRKRLAKFEELVKEGTLKDVLAEEGRVLLERMPVLKARQELRKAYQGLIDGKLELKDFEAKREAILASTRLKQTEANLFALKVLEATEVIREEYVREVNQGQMVAWAIRGLYDYLEEKLPTQLEGRLKNVRTMRLVHLRDLIAEARMHLGKREDIDNQKDLSITLQRMLHRLDPHTTYIDPETKKKFDDDIAGNFFGIGIQIRKDAATNHLLVVTPIKGSPAYHARLQAGDLITQIIREVDSKGKPLDPVEKTDTSKITLAAAVKMILGQPDTKVKLEIKRGKEKPFEVEITRGRVEIESVVGARRKPSDDWDYFIDPKNKIGYVRLTSFARNTYRDLENIMAELRRQGVKGMVLDLRFNPGGLLDVAIKVSDLFIDDGLIVSVRPRGGALRETRFNGRHTGSLLDFPMVCLINGYSASGSEIVSAALQDHNRAVVIGERSYGKGSVQNIRDFEVVDPKSGEPLKAEIKLTTASFWRPSGKNLNKASTAGKDDEEWGVIPDKVIKLSLKERRDLAEHQRNLETIEPPGQKDKPKEFNDRQLNAALEYLRGQIKTASRAPTTKSDS